MRPSTLMVVVLTVTGVIAWLFTPVSYVIFLALVIVIGSFDSERRRENRVSDHRRKPHGQTRHP